MLVEAQTKPFLLTLWYFIAPLGTEQWLLEASLLFSTSLPMVTSPASHTHCLALLPITVLLLTAGLNSTS